MREIVKHPQWKEVEELIEGKMRELLLDFPDEKTEKAVALHALANKKAYKILNGFLIDMDFLQEPAQPSVKRDFN
jgi:hypothetical protein